MKGTDLLFLRIGAFLFVMNLFILDSNPRLAAHYNCDKHVNKIIIESAQMLSAAHWLYGDNAYPHLMKLVFINHPVTVWVRMSRENYIWTTKYALGLCEEYKDRYWRTHKHERLHNWFANNIPEQITNQHLTPFQQSVYPDCVRDCGVEAYRVYYKLYKSKIATWRNGTPYWW